MTKTGGIFDIEGLKKELSSLEDKTQSGDFWNDNRKAQEILKKIKIHKATIEPWEKIHKDLEDSETLYSLLLESNDKNESDIDELEKSVAGILKEVEHYEFQNMLSDENDISNCYLYIHPGAGGTESCDWASMLMRMYARWAEKHEYKAEILDLQPGDEAGIKSVTLYIQGEYAYGYLKAENGVHRLVRISPFDANKRRHTSFAAVYASPEVDESIEIEIKESDIRIDRFRSSGAGGQHVNVTDSAIRITHFPTKIVVQCQNERSQHKNLAQAMNILRSRLYQHYLEKQLEEQAAKAETEKRAIEWGSQIRSYVFHPYNLVKDLRTDIETSNTEAVMDGEIDAFIEGYLRSRMGSKKV